MRTVGTIKGKSPARWLRGPLPKEGTKRARLLEAMLCRLTVAECARRAGMTRHQALVAARNMWVRCGVGYCVINGAFQALVPRER